MDIQTTLRFVETCWDQSITPKLVEFIRIPNKSPAFDPDWQEHGYMDQAIDLVEAWCRSQPIAGMQVEVIRLESLTPLIFIEIPGKGSDDTVLLYGHLDKQPEMTGWRDDLGPWKPVLEDERLYGRGGADDGYAVFASLTAIMALREQGLPHARCVVMIEASEESGSPDLPAYVEALRSRIGTPSLVVCLDSGCGNYDQLWNTTSLRGLVNGTLSVQVLKEGVHSGDAGGIVPSSFRVIRSLLSRLEDELSGEILPESLHAEVSEARLDEISTAADVLGSKIHDKYPFAGDTRPAPRNRFEMVLNRTWRPALAVIGVGGMPALADAGNVLRPGTQLMLSLRLPPTIDAAAAGRQLRELFESDPPYGARVSFDVDTSASGWEAPPLASWLATSMERASRDYFGPGSVSMGEGGSIPFMGMLGDAFPDAQFLITGVLGPKSNAHGPNEFLHIPTGKRITCCVARVLLDHCRRNADRV